MSALVWAVESAILGLWALVFSLYSNPFHTFIARSHASISGVTLAAHLFCAARDLDIGHEISEAFVCAVTGLWLMYTVALMDAGNYTTLFTMPVLDGFLPLDGCIGLGWFSAAFVSALGMALSHRGRKCKLMFHHFGYHMIIVPPSFLVFWLYNYDGRAAEPVSQAIQFFYDGIEMTHFIYSLVLAGLWGVFIVLQATGEMLQFELDWPSFSDMSANGWLRYALSVLLKSAGRLACILIPISAALTANTKAQIILAWVLTGIGTANLFDWLRVVDGVLGKREAEPESPSIHINSDPAALSLRWRDKDV